MNTAPLISRGSVKTEAIASVPESGSRAKTVTLSDDPTYTNAPSGLEIARPSGLPSDVMPSSPSVSCWRTAIPVTLQAGVGTEVSASQASSPRDATHDRVELQDAAEPDTAPPPTATLPCRSPGCQEDNFGSSI